jgi:hypothetical protein
MRLGHGYKEGIGSGQGKGIPLFSIASRPAKRLTQRLTQRAPEVLSLRKKRPKSKADNSPPSDAEYVELYFNTTVSLHGVVLCRTWAKLHIFHTYGANGFRDAVSIFVYKAMGFYRQIRSVI